MNPHGEWCGLCYTNKKGRTNAAGHYGYRPPWKGQRRHYDMAIARRSRSDDALVLNGSGGTDTILDGLPHLREFLTANRFDDGALRIVPTVLLYSEGGYWKGCVKDRAEEAECWLTSDTLGGWYLSMDTLLGTGTAAWRAMEQWGGKRKKK